MKPYLVVVVLLPSGYGYPFANGDTMLLLGEIDQMPGHVAVASKDGKVFWGYHAEHFRKLTEDEA